MAARYGVLSVAPRDSSYDAGMLEAIYSALLVAAFLAIAISAGYAVYRVYAGAR
jgi:hypothetical protein